MSDSTAAALAQKPKFFLPNTFAFLNLKVDNKRRIITEHGVGTTWQRLKLTNKEQRVNVTGCLPSKTPGRFDNAAHAYWLGKVENEMNLCIHFKFMRLTC